MRINYTNLYILRINKMITAIIENIFNEGIEKIWIEESESRDGKPERSVIKPVPTPDPGRVRKVSGTPAAQNKNC